MQKLPFTNPDSLTDRMKTVFWWKFPVGATVPNARLGTDESVEQTIRDARRAVKGKLDGDHVSDGIRSMILRCPTEEAADLVELKCGGIKQFERTPE
ncbi:hypothetical protein [Variovorax sp. LjRoot178]|uniref:hypothetical protein n=1 Tax=Variovorax sp. LjRoot178 TaxID=3342277 RepID=UPI003ED0D435